MHWHPLTKYISPFRDSSGGGSGGSGDGQASVGVDGVGVGSGVGNNTGQGNAGSVATDSTGVGIGSQTPGNAAASNAAEGAASAAAAAAAAQAETNAAIQAMLHGPQSMQNMIDINDMETGPQSVATNTQSGPSSIVDTIVQAITNPQQAIQNQIQSIINPTVPQAMHTVFGAMGIPTQAASTVAQAIGTGINAITGSTNEGAAAGQAAVGPGGGGDGDGSIDQLLLGQDENSLNTNIDPTKSYFEQLQDLFPSGYVANQLPFTLDDPFIDAILGRQRTEAEGGLTNALKRGQINDRGYNFGLGRLGEQTEAGRSLYQRRGEDVIRGYRSDVGDVLTDAFTAAAGAAPNSGFDVNFYGDQVNNRIGELKGRLEGDLSSAFSTSSPFDIGTAVNNAARVSGPVNAIADVMARRRSGSSTNDRGLGSRGVF